MVHEFCEYFGESTLRLEHIVYGPVNHLYDPFRRSQMNARAEVSLAD